MHMIDSDLQLIAAVCQVARWRMLGIAMTTGLPVIAD